MIPAKNSFGKRRIKANAHTKKYTRKKRVAKVLTDITAAANQKQHTKKW